jgi:hypothetical protein
MQAALADGSVRSIAPTLSAATWFAVLTPSAVPPEKQIGSDW